MTAVCARTTVEILCGSLGESRVGASSERQLGRRQKTGSERGYSALMLWRRELDIWYLVFVTWPALIDSRVAHGSDIDEARMSYLVRCQGGVLQALRHI